MQLEVLSLMAEKQVSVSAIQGGEFSSRGLSAMAKGIDPKILLYQKMILDFLFPFCHVFPQRNFPTLYYN